MEQTTAFLFEHGYLVLFAAILIDQAGLPVPVLPVVLAAGGMAGMGELDPILALAVVVVAAIPGDWAWYELGRAQGIRVVRTLCRISLEPDSCVRNTQGVFARHGVRSLLFAKFLPGLDTVAPPLAGAAALSRWRFLTYSTLGTALWGGSMLALGYVFHEQLEQLGNAFVELGAWAGLLFGAALAAYVGWKVARRQWFIRSLRTSRITPEELKAQIDAGDALTILDIRHALDYAADPVRIPGARHIASEELDRGETELPKDAEIILYCT